MSSRLAVEVPDVDVVLAACDKLAARAVQELQVERVVAVGRVSADSLSTLHVPDDEAVVVLSSHTGKEAVVKAEVERRHLHLVQ